MPWIHHELLDREMEVSDATVRIWTKVPHVPWKLGRLRRRTRPTATETDRPQRGTPLPPPEED